MYIYSPLYLIVVFRSKTGLDGGSIIGLQSPLGFIKFPSVNRSLLGFSLEYWMSVSDWDPKWGKKRKERKRKKREIDKIFCRRWEIHGRVNV